MISNGSMSASRSGTRAHVEVDPDLALGRHLRARGGQAGGAEVLQRDEQAVVEQLQRALEQLLLLERVADLDRRALGGVRARRARRDASTDAPPIPSRPVRAPNSTSTLPTPAAAERISSLRLDQPDAHRVDEAVLLVGALEVDLAADRGDADRVAVVADARDRVLEQVARARGGGDLAEAQRVEDRDRPRADREDVAQDAADAGGGALERLDRARVVVRLDLERARQPSPTSTAPAFSPGPITSFGPSVGSVAQQRLASACRRSARTTSGRRSPARRSLGSRSSLSTISSYSGSVRPELAGGARSPSCRHRRRAEQLQPVDGARERRRPRAPGAASGRARCPPALQTPAMSRASR